MEKEDMDDALVEEVVVDMDDALEDRLQEVDTEEAHRLDHPVDDTVVDRLQVALKDDIEADPLLVEIVEVDTEGVQEVDLVGATLVVHHEMVVDTLLVALEDHLLEMDIVVGHLDRLHEADTRVAQVVELEGATRKTLPHVPHLVDIADTAIAIVGHQEVEKHRRKKRRKPLF